MRNAVVVLVPLCIGLTSGFIVPSTIQELFNDDLSNINVKRYVGIRTRDTEPQIETDSKSMESGEILRSPKTLCTENNINNKLEKDLYNDTSKKSNNINERSFILIKQRFTQPIRNNFVGYDYNSNNNDKGRTTHSPNTNINFEEFQQKFAIGTTKTDKIVDNTNLRLNKSENQYTIQTNKGISNIYESNFKYNNIRNFSKGQRKYLVSYIKPFLKPYTEITPIANKVTSEPEIYGFRDTFEQQRKSQRVSNKNPYKLLYPGGKTIDSIINPNQGIYVLNSNKKLSNGNNDDEGFIGNSSLDDIIINNSLELDNNRRLNHSGSRHCPNCGDKTVKENINNHRVFEKKCKCKTKHPK